MAKVIFVHSIKYNLRKGLHNMTVLKLFCQRLQFLRAISVLVLAAQAVMLRFTFPLIAAGLPAIEKL